MKLRKWITDAAAMLFWAVIIAAVVFLFVVSAASKLGFRWGPGA